MWITLNTFGGSHIHRICVYFYINVSIKRVGILVAVYIIQGEGGNIEILSVFGCIILFFVINGFTTLDGCILIMQCCVIRYNCFLIIIQNVKRFFLFGFFVNFHNLIDLFISLTAQIFANINRLRSSIQNTHSNEVVCDEFINE